MAFINLLTCFIIADSLSLMTDRKDSPLRKKIQARLNETNEKLAIWFGKLLEKNGDASQDVLESLFKEEGLIQDLPNMKNAELFRDLLSILKDEALNRKKHKSFRTF